MLSAAQHDLVGKTTADAAVEEFVGLGFERYRELFARLESRGMAASEFNVAAFALGPIWALPRGLWLVFAISCIGDVLAGVMVASSFWSAPGQEMWANGTLLSGLALFVVLRVIQGLTANWAYYRRYKAWQLTRRGVVGFRPELLALGIALVLVIDPLMIYRFGWPNATGVLISFPARTQLTSILAGRIDALITWLTVNFDAVFTAMTRGVRHILNFLEIIFVGTPWPVVYLIVLATAWRVAGARVATFTAAALTYIGLFGYWDEAMRTMSLVGTSTLLCIAAGVPIGVWCAKSGRTNAVVRPILDVMQTMPSFVYLVPAIAFFSIGKPPGILATMVYALPIMIRLTSLGIQQVSAHTKEAAVAFGASPWQLLVKVELPLSVPSLMTGINQTIMMCLSMSVITALIGAGGLGDNILRALRYLETGNGILAGIAIALCAMILDRIAQGARAQLSRK